jgi:hypothetical protein
MQADAQRRGQAPLGAQACPAAIIGSVLTFEDVVAGGTAGLITKVAGDALLASKNAAGKQPSVAQLLERFER